MDQWMITPLIIEALSNKTGSRYPCIYQQLEIGFVKEHVSTYAANDVEI